jgi:glycerol-3-phosphate dehydrogenase
MYGTSHDSFQGAPGAARPSQSAVDALLADVNRAFPGAPVDHDEVSLVHWGLLPAERIDGPDVVLTRRSLVRDHRADRVGGLVTVIGVRYTTARQTAEDAVDLAAAMLDRGRVPCRTAVTPLAGGDIPDLDALCKRVERVCGTSGPDPARLVSSYGAEVDGVLGLLDESPEWRRPLGPACAVTRGEILYGIRFEQALTLPDVVLRRTEAGSAGHPGRDALEAAVAVMGEELGWDLPRRAAEVAAVEHHYELAPAAAPLPGTP